MTRRLTLLFILVVPAAVPSLAQTIYKWQDENGQTHFSDVPTEGAVEVDAQPAQSFTQPAMRQSSNSAASTADVVAPEAAGYKTLKTAHKSW